MGGLGAIITIILVVGWVVKGLSSAVVPKDDGQKKRSSRSLEEWDQIQAQRRAEMSGQQDALSELRADSSSQNPAQMTMAERIELARQRARQQAGLQGQGVQQAGSQNQGDQQAEALRRARAKAQQQAELQQRENAQRQRDQRERAARQERADRERAQQKRRRQAQQQADQEAQAKRQRRGNQQRRTRPQSQPQSQPRATTGSKRENVVAQSMQRIHKGHGHNAPAVAKVSSQPKAVGASNSIGPLDRHSLRKAFIMKELLDKPIALRGPQTELFS